MTDQGESLDFGPKQLSLCELFYMFMLFKKAVARVFSLWARDTVPYP